MWYILKSGKILNPLSNKPIKFKDLMPVVFTPVDEEANTSRVHSMAERYKCPVSGDVLTNSSRVAYIKPRYINVMLICDPNSSYF